MSTNMPMSGRSRKHHILVVDDEAIIRVSLAMLFQSKGYQISTATDGFDALLQLRTSSPDLITSDLNMPNMSGFEFLSVVRRRFPKIPVVAISGAYDCGEVPGGVIADGFYAKGRHHPEALLATVADLIRTSARELELISSNRLRSGSLAMEKTQTECRLSWCPVPSACGRFR